MEYYRLFTGIERVGRHMWLRTGGGYGINEVLMEAVRDQSGVGVSLSDWKISFMCT